MRATNNILNVGELKAMLDKMGVEDHVVIAASCCQGADGHALLLGDVTYAHKGKSETISLDPDVVETEEYGATLRFVADRDYIHEAGAYGPDDDDDTEGED